MRVIREQFASRSSVWRVWSLAALLASSTGTAHADAGVSRATRAAPHAALVMQSAQPQPLAAAQAVRMPSEWMPAHGRECATSGKYKNFCQGPRRVPKPFGADAARATQLGLGTLEAAGDLLYTKPKPEWVQAAAPDRHETLQWPVDDGKLWRGLQAPRRTQNKFHPRHKGLDIGAPEGTPIRAAKSGLVAYSDNEVHGYGNLLVIVHPDGSVALYGHCHAIYVFPGQHVTQGQVVGEVGHTGIARGTHLHFEYRVAGYIRNPLKYFDEAIAHRESARIARK
jgi:murein DD-endopeptidase MepM/ murein hydrolase activator NlpD